jgi:UDP-glucuronate decarboxylase
MHNKTNDKTILITGATGFIGTNLTIKLLTNNYKIIAVDNHFSSSQKNLETINNHILKQQIDNNNFIFFNYDIINSLENLITQKVDYIFNLACPASPPQYQRDPIYTFKTSIWGVENLIQLALKNDCPLVHSSTSEVYGDALIHPQDENYFGNVNTVGIRSCYDEGKRASETLIYGYVKTKNLKGKIVRIFNTYGPFMDKNDGRVVSNFINQAIKNHDITIYGNGLQTRSFCYIDDLLEILVKFAFANDNLMGPLNIGNPQEFTVTNLANLIIKLTNSKSKIIYLPLPQDDPKQRCPNIDLAKSLFDFSPKISLYEGLIKTIKYFENS